MTQIVDERRAMANGDTLLLGVNALYALVAWAIGVQSGRDAAGLVGGALLLVLAALLWAALRGTLACRLGMAAIAMALVSLQIHVGWGENLYHFGVFVTLAVLLVYRDWRVPVLAAAAIALHHAAFNVLQAWGWGVSCFTRPGWGQVASHAGYVVMQTAIEVYIAVRLAHEARRDREIQQLLLDADGKVNLDVGQARVTTDLAASVLATLARMRDAVAGVKSSAAALDASAAATAGHNEALSRHIAADALRLLQAADAVRRLAATATANADAAQRAAGLARAAQETTARGGAAVQQLQRTMTEISTSSERIADIIGLIDGIAFQTNLLALNAAVEAARAGEQGRGFAVVAAEVRALARRSADAARETKALILEARERVEGGTRMVADTEGAMHDTVSAVHGLAGLAREIAGACGGQLRELEEVRGGVAGLEQSAQASGELVRLCVAASAVVAREALALVETAGRFRLDEAREAPAIAASPGRAAPDPWPAHMHGAPAR